MAPFINPNLVGNIFGVLAPNSLLAQASAGHLDSQARLMRLDFSIPPAEKEMVQKISQEINNKMEKIKELSSGKAGYDQIEAACKELRDDMSRQKWIPPGESLKDQFGIWGFKSALKAVKELFEFAETIHSLTTDSGYDQDTLNSVFRDIESGIENSVDTLAKSLSETDRKVPKTCKTIQEAFDSLIASIRSGNAAHFANEAPASIAEGSAPVASSSTKYDPDKSQSDFCNAIKEIYESFKFDGLKSTGRDYINAASKLINKQIIEKKLKTEDFIFLNQKAQKVLSCIESARNLKIDSTQSIEKFSEDIEAIRNKIQLNIKEILEKNSEGIDKKIHTAFNAIGQAAEGLIDYLAIDKTLQKAEKSFGTYKGANDFLKACNEIRAEINIKEWFTKEYRDTRETIFKQIKDVDRIIDNIFNPEYKIPDLSHEESLQRIRSSLGIVIGNEHGNTLISPSNQYKNIRAAIRSLIDSLLKQNCNVASVAASLDTLNLA